MFDAVSNLRWADADQTMIDCTVTLAGRELPFTASADDIDERGSGVFFAAMLGEFGPIAPFEAPAPIAPSAADVIADRARRLALGFDYDFGDDRGVHRIGTTEADYVGWDRVSKLASAAIALGQGEAPIGIVTDTGPVTVTALEWQSILIAGGQWEQPIWHASFTLQAMDPIPADYADDARWPA